MIKLEGIVLNVFTQQGGTNKKAKHLMIGTKFRFLALWICRMGKSKTN